MRNFLRKPCPLQRSLTFFKPRLLRSYSKDMEKDKDDKEVMGDEENKYRKGILHDKQKSIQEESYFHKEEMEQLKALKKKVINKESESKEENKKKD